MTVLEDLLEQVEMDEAECPDPPKEWGDGVFEMPFSVAKTLLQIAEAAFDEISEESSSRDLPQAFSFWQLVRHLKKELECDKQDTPAPSPDPSAASQ